MIISVGVDIVEIARIARMNSIYSYKFPKRILTTRELEIFDELNESRRVFFVAGRFAAKEAFTKAIGTGIGKLAFTDIDISYGKPRIVMTEKIIKILEENFGKNVYNALISISHEKNNAIAMVLIDKI